MDYIKPDIYTANAAVLGGAFLGGGGGGWINDGLKMAKLALQIGDLKIINIDDLTAEATLVTVSAVGAPAATERYIKPIYYAKAVELLIKEGIKVDGLISSENGAIGTINGWFQSTLLGIPVVDSPCNGRAHPTGTMGSMGLTNVEDYVSIQAAVGGDPRKGKYMEVLVRGSLEKTATLIRQAAVVAGGFIAVARNPVKSSYVKRNGAPGALKKAIDVGKALLENKSAGGKAMIMAATKKLQGDLVAEGVVNKVIIETLGGFDVGTVIIDADETYKLTFWNEYMTLEKGEERVGTFPDLIVTSNLENGLPISTAEIKKGQRVAIICVPKAKLILGAGMRDQRLLKQVENIIKKVVRYTI